MHRIYILTNQHLENQLENLLEGALAFHQTYSYRELDDHAKHILNEIYVHYFYERQENFWRDQAMIKLQILISEPGKNPKASTNKQLTVMMTRISMLASNGVVSSDLSKYISLITRI